MFAHHDSNRPLALGAALRQNRKQLGSRLRSHAGADDTAFVAGWPDLVAEVEAGFRKQESLMEALGYGGLPLQWLENACALRALHRVTPQVEAGQTVLGRQALAALADILSLHASGAGTAPAAEAGHGGPAAASFRPRTARRALPWTGHAGATPGRHRR